MLEVVHEEENENDIEPLISIPTLKELEHYDTLELKNEIEKLTKQNCIAILSLNQHQDYNKYIILAVDSINDIPNSIVSAINRNFNSYIYGIHDNELFSSIDLYKCKIIFINGLYFSSDQIFTFKKLKEELQKIDIESINYYNETN